MLPFLPCRDGGTGIRAGLKIPCSQGLEGSSPSPGTISMLYTVYAIASIGRKYVYIGMTDNLERRMKQHQNGLNRTTKPYRPFEQIYTETFSTRWEAREREKKLKTGSEREKLYLLREEKIDKSTRA